MFNTQTFPKTPAAARMVKTLSRLTPIRIAPEIENLSTQMSPELVQISNTLGLASDELDLIQYILDRNHRALIPLDGTKSSAFRNIVIAASLSNSKRILVMVRDQAEATNIINGVKHLCPNDRVANSLNDVPDDAQRCWFVCQYRELDDTKFVGRLKIDHFVCLENERSMPYDSAERVQLLTKEIFRTTLTIRTFNFWIDFASDASGSECIRVKDFILAYFGSAPCYLDAFTESRFVSKALHYLRSNNRMYDLRAALLLSGFCVDAIEASSKTAPRVVACDNFYRSYFHMTTKQDRKSEDISNYHKAVKTLEVRMNSTISEIVEQAISGEDSARTALDSLKSKSWQKHKANLFFDALRRSNNFDERTILISPFNATRKQISLTMRAFDVSGDFNSDNREKIFNDFRFPEFEDANNPAVKHLDRPVRVLLFDDIKNVPDDILMSASKVIFTEMPYSLEDFEDIKSLTKAIQAVLYFGWCRGTFEDILVRKTTHGHTFEYK